MAISSEVRIGLEVEVVVWRYRECLNTIPVIRVAYGEEFSTDSISLIRLNDASQSEEVNSYLLEACCTVGRESPWISHLQMMQGDKKGMSFKFE